MNNSVGAVPFPRRSGKAGKESQREVGWGWGCDGEGEAGSDDGSSVSTAEPLEITPLGFWSKDQAE